MARNKFQLDRELLALYDRIKFDRADGRCECEGECGRSHRFGIHYRCSNTHGRPAVTGGERMVSLVVRYLDGDTGNAVEHNMMAMCGDCVKRHRSKFKSETKRGAERAAIEAAHEPLFDLGEITPAPVAPGAHL
ncbi:HNH endonuclease [Mycobacterium Phage Nergal]|nr:HNH endonuclease [Mycobacterium Phage Nergal]